MKTNVLRVVIMLLGLAMLMALFTLASHAAPAPTLFGDVGVCDPWYPQRCTAPLGRQKPAVAGDQFGVTISAATAPTTPSDATGVLVIPLGTNNTTGGCLLWRDDGTDPTSTVGNPVGAGVPMWYYVKSSAISSTLNAAFKVIAASGATCTVNFIYFK